jgi:FGGY-family pentulose kinase
MASRCTLGVDVGSGSVRAGLFDATGRMLGIGSEPIRVWRPRDDFVEQSSDDIWNAAGEAIRAALRQAGATPECVVGVGFDATCSLVVVDAQGAPVTVSPGGDDQQNVIVWMDHRAIDQARRINATGHEVLRYVGGGVSPEMQTPKLLWLLENLPHSWERAAHFLDLADFMTWRATGSDTRSLCTTVCKWTYLAHGSGWQDDFLRAIGLGTLVADGYARIGPRVRPMGERVGGLTQHAAAELGLLPGTAVGVGIIDAHAGGLGLLGMPVGGVPATPETLERRVALIGGTSTCHMAVSREPRFIPGVWGPYHSAMVPDLWLTEGGQSATGALIDHVIDSHARSWELRRDAEEQQTTVYRLLNQLLEALGAEAEHPAAITRDLHVLPYFHGNRSPRADPTLRGAVSGLGLSAGVEALARSYLATIQAIAYGTRHILEALDAHGYHVDTLLCCGGDTKNPIFVREHADATGCRVVLPREPEAVLLGSAMLGAVACGDQPSVLAAMQAMGAAAQVIEPASGATREYHRKKYQVFLKMYDDQLGYRRLMQ